MNYIRGAFFSIGEAFLIRNSYWPYLAMIRSFFSFEGITYCIVLRVWVSALWFKFRIEEEKVKVVSYYLNFIIKLFKIAQRIQKTLTVLSCLDSVLALFMLTSRYSQSSVSVSSIVRILLILSLRCFFTLKVIPLWKVTETQQELVLPWEKCKFPLNSWFHSSSNPIEECGSSKNE